MNYDVYDQSMRETFHFPRVDHSLKLETKDGPTGPIPIRSIFSLFIQLSPEQIEQWNRKAEEISTYEFRAKSYVAQQMRCPVGFLSETTISPAQERGDVLCLTGAPIVIAYILYQVFQT